MIDLKETYGKRYKVTVEESWAAGEERPKIEFFEIVGKRGYIRPWGDNQMEVYVSSIPMANKIEREYKQFVPKNHYDDATAFVIGPESIALACKCIRARNRRQVTEAMREAGRALALRYPKKP